MSSSRPGASPTNITRASDCRRRTRVGGGAAQGATFEAVRIALPPGWRRFLPPRARHDRSVSVAEARGRRGPPLGGGRANGAGADRPRPRSLWRSGRGFGRRVGKPVDRRFADQRVDARLLVEGEKLAGSLVTVSVHSRCAVRPWRNACNHARGTPALKVRLVRIVGFGRLVPRHAGGGRSCDNLLVVISPRNKLDLCASA